MNWFQIVQLAFELVTAVESAEAAIMADQPFSSPPIYTYLSGKKYGITVNGTPQQG